MYRPRLIVLLVAATLLMTLAATPALAGRGGNKPGGSTSTTATLTATPNPASAGGATYKVTGSGFTAGSPVSINMADPGCCLAFDIWPDAYGRISFSKTTRGAGTYKIEAYQQSGRKMILMAAMTLSVN